MKILIYGAGVLGSNLAFNLQKAGLDTTLLARGNWAKQIETKGLRIKNKFSLLTKKCTIPVVTSLSPDDYYDAIFVVMRYTTLDSIIDILKANKSKNIIFVGNNVKLRELKAKLSDKNVLFAFSLSAGHREEKRVVSIDLKTITIGQLKEDKPEKELIKDIFADTKYRVIYEPNMEDYLLCHAAFVIPAAFACYKTDGKLKRLKHNKTYLNKVIDANIEAYSAIKNSGHEILPKTDANFMSPSYRKACMRFFRLMCATPLGKVCASDHALNATEEMSALNSDFKKFMDANNALYSVWKELESECGNYLT